MSRSFISLIIGATVLIILSACSDRLNPSDGPSSEIITADEPVISLGYNARSYNVRVNMADTTFSASSDCKWLNLDRQRISSNGYLDFTVTENEGLSARTAIITVSGTKASCTIEVVQSSRYGDENDIIDDLTARFAVGYGYNEFLSYCDPSAVTCPILNYSALKILEQQLSMSVLSDEIRHRLSAEINISRSTFEMCRFLTENTHSYSSSNSFLKLSRYQKTVFRVDSIGVSKSIESEYGYYRLKKIAASRCLDLGVLEYCLKNGNTDIFSADFSNCYKEILRNPSDANILKMVRMYGTALVIQADLGGYIDMVLAVDASYTRNDRDVMMQICQRRLSLFRTNPIDMRYAHTDSVRKYSNSIMNNSSVKIQGGDNDAAESIRNYIRDYGTSTYSSLKYELIETWLNSLDNDMAQDNLSGKFELVDCKLLDIAELFTDKSIRDRINYIISQEANTNDLYWNKNRWAAYRITLSDSQTSFNDSGTLVRLVEINGNAAIQICNEYVPNIRTDKRVNILYPINNGTPNIQRGFYPGDSDGTPAAYVSFSGKDCYVRPLENISSALPVTTIYKSEGRLLTDGEDLYLDDASTVQTHDINLILNDFNKSEFTSPIVKIGDAFWTRRNMTGSMGFGKIVGYTFEVDEFFRGEMLYANYFDGNHERFTKELNPGIYGDRTCWYLPTEHDMYTLQTFVGDNLKSLFKKHQTGFDAQFAGYFGRYFFRSFLINDNGFVTLNDENKGCYIPFRNNASEGTALCLTNSYTLERVHETIVKNSYFPIRLIRPVTTMMY